MDYWLGRGLKVGAHFFFALLAKILISLMLRLVDLGYPRQNIEKEGVTGKILRNKELAECCFRDAGFASRPGRIRPPVHEFWVARTGLVLRFSCPWVKVVRHKERIYFGNGCGKRPTTAGTGEHRGLTD